MTAFVALLSFAAGFLIGLLCRRSLDRYRADRKESTMPVPDAPPRERNLWRVLLVALLAFNFVVGVMLILTRASSEEYTRCTAEWQQQFAQAYSVRSDAAADVSGAVDAIVMSVNAGDEAAFQRAVDQYVKLRDEQNEQRAKSPLPALPEQVCGAAEEVRR